MLAKNDNKTQFTKMAESKPSKDDIQAIFRKLRAIPTNKVCFDCSSKNPTWASVTYGVFICIDCSAVHRGLGVHLTFVRSTQLDTNWTWQQLRQMQLGGNASASVFFRQHNCETTDAQQKYTSRAAQLYKDKLTQLALNAMKIHGTELHIEAHHEKTEDKKEVDFFEEHSSFSSLIDGAGLDKSTPLQTTLPDPKIPFTAPLAASLGAGQGPTVDLSAPFTVPTGERKSIIGGRKGPAKKTMGAKRGLGAQKVQTNFADLERQAEMIDQRKEKLSEEVKVTPEEQEEQIVSMRLAYQDLSLEQEKEQEKLKRSDPKKAQQVERLGMGFASKSAFSHSAVSDMQTIEQETPIKSSRGKSAFDSDPTDDLFDEYNFPASFGMFRNMPSQSLKLSDIVAQMDKCSEQEPERDRFSSRERSSDLPSSKSWYDGMSQDQEKRPPPRRDPIPAAASSDDAQKKFGSAKSISSDQYFNDSSDNNYERKANLARFEGSSSISSSDYFGDGRDVGSRRPGYTSGISSSISAPDLDEVKESVRQGVTKVAGRISSLANGVINSIQDRYGY